MLQQTSQRQHGYKTQRAPCCLLKIGLRRKAPSLRPHTQPRDSAAINTAYDCCTFEDRKLLLQTEPSSNTKHRGQTWPCWAMTSLQNSVLWWLQSACLQCIITRVKLNNIIIAYNEAKYSKPMANKWQYFSEWFSTSVNLRDLWEEKYLTFRTFS